MSENEGVMAKLVRILQSANQFLSPRRKACLSCKQPAIIDANTLGFCHSCFLTIPWIVQVLCPDCGRYEKCMDCSRREMTYFTQNRSAVQYDEAMKELLARYKYRGDERLKQTLGEMLTHAFRLLQTGKLTKSGVPIKPILTYVPVSEERLLERGFNQAEQMAAVLGEIVKLPVIPLLQRVRHTEKQSFKSRNERLGDLQHVFEINEGGLSKAGALTGQIQIYLIDDVYTTGSTLNQCAKVIKQHIESEIFGLTWAR